MTMVAAERELFDACRIIFGLDDVSREFLEYIQPSGIKSAYRQKARETHPDLVATQGDLVQRRHAQLFTNVQNAYEKLNHYLEAREKGFRFQSLPPRPAATSTYHYRTAPPVKTTDRRYTSAQNIFIDQTNLYSGVIPSHRLLFGHYLYYAGLINWRTIIQALVWQRGNRPRLGELGNRFGWLKNDDISTILRHRTLLHPFGESAVELGYLSEMQLKSLLFQQKRLQKRFGDFFTENALFSAARMELLANSHTHHNIRAAGNIRFGCRF
ncbi:MAG: hypothetical protein A2511_03435 [Deltaproteobacteria bacterium RIFOXYD12_FULL_50_9]|nr:MAG: hypothetical protein A2511_03435 [Deltaproteobacteria bacterium RIFOXYD12_FULL_50_9]